jgi:hypothetical protein
VSTSWNEVHYPRPCPPGHHSMAPVDSKGGGKSYILSKLVYSSVHMILHLEISLHWLCTLPGRRVCAAVRRWIYISLCERSWPYGSILPARESLDNVELFPPGSAPTLHRTTVIDDSCYSGVEKELQLAMD